jgi:hypothetical protein
MDGDLRFCGITSASFKKPGDPEQGDMILLAGLTAKGEVFVWNEERSGWVKMSMKEISPVKGDELGFGYSKN